MKLIEVTPDKNYRLFLRYDDGANGIVDLSALAGKGVFSAWLQPSLFGQARLAEAGHPEWPGGLDLCPDALYLQLTGKVPRELYPFLHDQPSRA